MPRVSLAALVTVALSVCAAPSPVHAQKGKATPPPIAVTATFQFLESGLLLATPAQSQDDAIQPVESCTFDGAIAVDTGHFTTSASDCTRVAFGSATFFEVTGNPLQPTTVGSAASFFVRNVGKALPAGGPIAGQFGVAWTGESAADGIARAYSLQFGDAFDASIDYARTTCVASVEGLCTEWEVTSLRGSAPTGDTTLRDTGPLGRLSVTTGRGSRGTQVLASQLEVPYTIRIVRK